MSNPKDSVSRTVIVALVLCVVCSVIVSAAAVMLRGKQQENAVNEKKMNILAAAGIEVVNGDLETAFATITPKLVDMRTGEFSTDEDVMSYNMRKAAKDPTKARALTREQDIASIRKQSLYSTVYLVEGEQGIERIILPIHGYGLWSTLYGFIALESDLNTVAGLGFYEHAETPGLGGEVVNPKWKALWPGKKVYADNSYIPAIGLIKGKAAAGDMYKVDGLAGATLTSNGVTNLVKFWLGENGFAPFLSKLKAGEA